jgi:hypothetical protein
VTFILGYAGVHAECTVEKFGADPFAIFIELGKRRVVNGQKNQMIAVAYIVSQDASKLAIL